MSKAVPQFDINLKYGQIVENSVAALLCEVPFEVKADDAAKRNGNLCIEFRQFGPDWENRVPSGIATTTALWTFIRFDEDRYIVIRTTAMKKIARDFYKRGRVKDTGDKGNVSVLVPISALFATIAIVGRT